uniref:Mitochondrial inner membrane protease subunit n=1 Tax=Lygus hesperus TaxID=30085 RepID=A0A0A9W0S6_LYGHE
MITAIASKYTHWLPIAAICAIGVLAEEVITPSVVVGQSMCPTLNNENNTDTDIILVNKLNRFNVNIGDVVCFRSPTDPAKIFIKRVLAKEGEWIPVDQDGITVPFQVPKGHTWVEGDNTFHSYDSRLLGPIPLGLMLGKATHVVWPPHKFSKIDTTVTERRNV